MQVEVSREQSPSEDRPSCQSCKKAGRDCVYTSQAAVEAAQLDDANPEPGDGMSGVEQEQDPVTNEGSLLSVSEPADARPNINETGLIRPVAALPSPEWSMSTQQMVNDIDGFGASPGSSWSDSLPYSAENASLRWFGLLATDATLGFDFSSSATVLQTSTTQDIGGTFGTSNSTTATHEQHFGGDLHNSKESFAGYSNADEAPLRDDQLPLFQHFVQNLSSWIDITDPGKSFSVVVPHMALGDPGLMNSILALSSRHLSLRSTTLQQGQHWPADRTQAVQYYNEALRYLQQAMKNPSYLRSDELLATVLTISTYEMIDGSDRGWERHLKGVFWIQRSQLIHGESHGLKKWIWWAWLRQDIWAAFRERRRILSYYTMTKACADLDFWELVNRAVFLLGQCINYASDTEIAAGRLNLPARLQRAEHLWTFLEEWRGCFAIHDRRLPAPRRTSSSPFAPVWINPPAASLAVQVHHFSRLLLLEHMPALEGLKELVRREASVQESVNVISGIASCTSEEAAMLVSTQCLYAAGTHVRDANKQHDVLEMIHSHQSKTGWPHYDIGAELRMRWGTS
ncbi:hypothetical protein LTS10_009661 [Elasticomyces elasticus]|nr:hypothetical protein LTS10_009661 [Elasticomyces elasticus]